MMQRSATRPGSSLTVAGLSTGSPLHVTAKLFSHRRQHFLSKRVVSARPESHVERHRQDLSRHSFLERRRYSPPALARILYEPGVTFEVRIFGQCNRAQIEQPGTDYA